MALDAGAARTSQINHVAIALWDPAFRSLFLDATSRFAVAGDHPVAQGFIRGSDEIGADLKFPLSRILRDQFQSEMEVLEPVRAKIANSLAFGQSLLNKQLRRLLGKLQFHPVRFLE